MIEGKKIEVKAYNKTTLAGLYGVSVETFTKWIAPFADLIGPVIGRIFTPKQVKVIFDCLGEP